MAATACVCIDRPAPHVARLLIDRPDKRNAIDRSVREALTNAFGGLLAEPGIRALVFGGVGGYFSAGGDLASMAGLSESAAHERLRHGHALCRLLGQARIPVVSAVEGVAVGAAVGLALLSDFIVVGAGTRIMFPFMKLGLTPDWATALTLPRRVGLPAARRLLSESATVDGAQAQRLGLADWQVDDAQVMPFAVEQAARLAQLPLGAYAAMKQRLDRSSASLAEELAREEHDQAACFIGAEFAEGLAAFGERRAARFADDVSSP